MEIMDALRSTKSLDRVVRVPFRVGDRDSFHRPQHAEVQLDRGAGFGSADSDESIGFVIHEFRSADM